MNIFRVKNAVFVRSNDNAKGRRKEKDNELACKIS